MPRSSFQRRHPSMAFSASAVYASSAPYSSRTTLLMSVEAASGCGTGPGSTSLTSWPRLRSSRAAVSPKIPAPATSTRMPPHLARAGARSQPEAEVVEEALAQLLQPSAAGEGDRVHRRGAVEVVAELV